MIHVKDQDTVLSIFMRNENNSIDKDIIIKVEV